ncbi:TetR/AcrR family transcriptional regulator [Mycetocola reblochoni]|nr:TetR/AcrR family transcriptional regulator [Mycetocola reblochoni]
MTDTPVRATRRDAAQNREQLISTAMEVLRDNPAASLDEIARRAGLSRRGLYGHFRSREELMRVVIQRGATRIADHVGHIDDSDPLLAIALIAARIWDQIAAIRVNAALALQDPYRGDVATTLEPLRAQLRAIIDTGIRSGRLPDDLPADTVAVLVESTALGVLDSVARDRVPADEALPLIVLSGLGAAGLSRPDAQIVFERFRAVHGQAPTVSSNGELA